MLWITKKKNGNCFICCEAFYYCAKDKNFCTAENDKHFLIYKPIGKLKRRRF